MSAPAPWLPTAPLARGVLWGSLALGFLLKARVALFDDGINWPDEIYQSFEPAHRLVFGHGLVAWEYLEGARTWAVPGFVAVWLWLCKLLGLGPAAYVPFVKLVFAAASTAGALGVYRLARGFGSRELEAAVSAATWSLCALALYFSPRAMSENLAAALCVWGVALVLEADATRRGRLWGASLLGLAVLCRLQMGVVCVGVLVALAVPRRGQPRDWRPLGEVFAALVVWALVFGAWDAAAWHDVAGAKFGGFFHSAFVYWRYNIVENRGAGWGTAPWSYFFVHLFRTMPGVTLALGAGLVLAARRAWPLVLISVLFLGLHLFVAHKELRFIVPLVPLACAFIGVGLGVLPQAPARLALGAVALAVAVSAATHRGLTMGEVGSYPERAASSAWDDFGVVNRLLLAASTQPDLCGLRIDAAHLAWTGGSTYLHTRAPLYMPGFPPQHGFFNYVIARAGSGAPVVAKEGPWELVKVGATCTPDVNYAWKLS